MDLKEFLKNNKRPLPWDKSHILKDGTEDLIYEDSIKLESLGLFFWERGGKEFCKYVKYKYIKYEDYYKLAFNTINEDYLNIPRDIAQDFLDCVDCLGEERVKELVKDLEGREKQNEL